MRASTGSASALSPTMTSCPILSRKSCRALSAWACGRSRDSALYVLHSQAALQLLSAAFSPLHGAAQCTPSHTLCYDIAHRIESICEEVRKRTDHTQRFTFHDVPTLSNTEAKYGQAGCGARCINAALLGRRQRGAAGDPALS